MIILSAAQGRQQRLKELEDFEKRLTAIVLQERLDDLSDVLDFEVIVGLERQVRAAVIDDDLQKKGEHYCRIYNTACARRWYGPKFLSVKDILTKERQSLRTDIRFFKAEEEDLDFAYITYSWGRSPLEYGWKDGVMVELERIGGGWKIRALFPVDY